MPGGIGPLELAIVLVIVLLIFGPKRLPGLGRQLGAGMRDFKDSIPAKPKGDEDDEEERPQIARPEPPPPPRAEAEVPAPPAEPSEPRA